MVRVMIAALVLLSSSAAAAQADDVERQKSTAAIDAVEDHWSRAFIGGDAAYLDALLTADYVSVSASGVHDKAAVIAAATKYAATKPAPFTPHGHSPVRLDGDTAIVRHSSAKDVSVDVFLYRGGRWQAAYSQHTAPKPA